MVIVEERRQPEQSKSNLRSSRPVLEGADEDAEGADSTMRDELVMMARDDPMWTTELRKYLQKERAVRLARWREGIVVQPT